MPCPQTNTKQGRIRPRPIQFFCSCLLPQQAWWGAWGRVKGGFLCGHKLQVKPHPLPDLSPLCATTTEAMTYARHYVNSVTSEDCMHPQRSGSRFMLRPTEHSGECAAWSSVRTSKWTSGATPPPHGGHSAKRQKALHLGGLPSCLSPFLGLQGREQG